MEAMGVNISVAERAFKARVSAHSLEPGFSPCGYALGLRIWLPLRERTFVPPYTGPKGPVRSGDRQRGPQRAALPR